MMYKKFLIVVFIVLFFSVSLAQQPPADLFKHTFSYITTLLNDRIFKEIRQHIKSVKLFPYTQEIGQQLTEDVANIIVKYQVNRDIILKDFPGVALKGVPTKKPGEIMMYLQIRLNIIEHDHVYNGKPVMSHLLIIKNIFVAMNTKTVKT